MGAAAALRVDIEGATLRVPASAWSLPGFRTWVTSLDLPAAARATFVDGEVLVDLSPESIESHNKVKGALTAGVIEIVQAADLGEVYPDGALLTHPRAGVSTEPDLCFASWETLSSGRVRFTKRAGRDDEYIEIVGTPDLVVEIVSDSSEDKDLRRLRSAYARAKIPEYWLVDARGPRIAFSILRLGRGGYRASAPADRPQTSTVLGRVVKLERTKNRVGSWTYRVRSTAA